MEDTASARGSMAVSPATDSAVRADSEAEAFRDFDGGFFGFGYPDDYPLYYPYYYACPFYGSYFGY
jgi:hypothetical protein